MTTTWKRGAFVLLLALAVVTFGYRLGDAPLLDDPNEAEYAEVAREMVETGDWLSPQLNYVLFLNKPPLTYWLIGVSDLAFGVNEFAARLPSALAGVVIVLLLVMLGARLYDAETGLLAGFILVAMGGFFVETHEVRPDLLMTAGVVGTLLALSMLITQATGPPRGSACIAFQVSLATALLAKGMLPMVLAGLVVAAMVVGTRRFDMIRQLLHPRCWWLLVVLVVPWHAAMSWRHPGFLWDYVINQHVLFFFDRKFPRDSVPVSLLAFWAAFALRLFPWTVFAPLAVMAAGWGARPDPQARAQRFGDRFVLAWAAAVLLFFSAASSRMEHYSIPALPAVALLIARLFRGYVADAQSRLGRVLTIHVVGFAVLTLIGPCVVPGVVAAQEWLAPIHELPSLARWTFILLAAGMMSAACASLFNQRRWVAPAIVATFVATVPLFAYGLRLLAPVNSSGPMAAALRVLVEPGERIVYESPIEYQNCAGFNFYLRTKLDLLRPPGFVAPPYLQSHLDELFISRDDLQRLWQEERVFFISDPLQTRIHAEGLVPQPFSIVARDHQRWCLSNRPL